jgi:hypothetical protein
MSAADVQALIDSKPRAQQLAGDPGVKPLADPSHAGPGEEKPLTT